MSNGLHWFPVTTTLPDGTIHRETLVRWHDSRVGVLARTSEGMPTGRRGVSWVYIEPADIEPATTDTRILTASGEVTFVPNGTCQKCGNPLALFRQTPIPTVDFPEVLVGAMSPTPGVFSPDREVEVEG